MNIRIHEYVYLTAESTFTENILKDLLRMLSRLPRELLEELVVIRKRYKFVYIGGELTIWVDGGVILSIHATSKELSYANGFMLSGSGIVLVSVTQDNVHIMCHPLTLRLPLHDCDVESFHRTLDSIPLETALVVGLTGPYGHVGCAGPTDLRG